MVVLGGWLFADLLLGLSMLFLVANTVGSEPPTPTPTPDPDYRATATVEFANQQAENQGTVDALEDQIALADTAAEQTAAAIDEQERNAAAQATEEAYAAETQAAMDDSEAATFAAGATESAANAQGTIDAISTEQASDASSNQAAAEAQATTETEATELAGQIDAQSTEQAQISAQATEAAESGADTQGTIIAYETSDAESQSAQATSDANASNAQSTADALEASQSDIDATIAALENEAQANTLSPNPVTETISIDINGILADDGDAIDSARDQLDDVLAKYINGTNCRIGFANISTNAPDVASGSQASARIAALIENDYPELLLQIEGQDPVLANQPFAIPNGQPTGQVDLQLFVNQGCQPAG
jgi:hypothetical protein